jgi:hypothetical protein
MGKSSLRVQAAKRLQADGIICATVDLSGIGNRNITPDQWYADITMRLVRNLQLMGRFQLRPWLAERQDLSPVARLGEFLEAVLPEYIAEPVVIFFDEIDSTLSLSFDTDDFFALIRSCHEPKQLTFALLGVATPSDLIADRTRTPFNIGRAIQLSGFKPQEVAPLEPGFVNKVENPSLILKEILGWTEGQPFLTQKLCQLVLQSKAGELEEQRVIPELDFHLRELMRKLLIQPKEIADHVALVVQSCIIDNWAAQDEPPHLRTIRDRLLTNQQRASHLLGLYQQILEQGKIPVDDSAEQIELQLSGLVVKREGYLQVYNRIYQSVFNPEWVARQLTKLRPYAELLNAWGASNFQDESLLLRGQALKEAQAWTQGKNLSSQDYRFLAASQALENCTLQEALDTAERNQKKLMIAQQRSQHTIRRGSAALILLALVTAFCCILSVFLLWQRNSPVQPARQTQSLLHEP